MMHLQKNSRITAVCEDLTHDGLGVLKLDAFPIFAENALPGETVEAVITKAGKKFAFAKVTSILQPSPHRVPILDKKGTWTGTTPLQHLAYNQQLLFKQSLVQNVMRKIAHMPDVCVNPTIPAAHQTHYRNKAQIPVREVNGTLQTGFFRKNSHTLVEMDQFLIQEPIIDELVVFIRQLLQHYAISAYDEVHHTGCIRHIVIRRGHYTKQLQVILVTRTAHLPHADELVHRIIDAYPDVKSIVHNVHPLKNNVIMGETTQVLYGEDAICDTLLGRSFYMSSRSFYQVNTLQTEQLYRCAIEAAQLTGKEIVIDAYCGIGTIGICLADQAKHVYGVEIVEDAIYMAQHNAQINQLSNTTFVAGKAEDIMPQWIQEGIRPDVIIVDPPRKGLDRSFIEASTHVSPSRIVYISCNPATLARDLAIYHEKGYTVSTIQPVDMFPQTTHVECVALLVKA